MKTNLFLITKYWRYHKKQFASMLTSIVILTAFLLIALLMERTECRRQYDDKLRGSSKTFYLYSNLGSDAYEEMSQDKRVSMIGRTAICGKLGNDKTQYTYGTYIDDTAEELEYVKLSSGRFPEKTGEAAVYDYVLEDMFFTVDPDSYVGKEVTFDSYDLDDTYLLRTGRHVGQITFTITGVLCTDSRRDLKENRVDWGSDLSEVQMPTIYLWRDDCDLDENTFVYTAVSLYGDDEITEQSESAMEEFAQDYYDKTGIWPRSGRSRSAAEDICNITLGNEKLNSESYLSDSVQGILYFSVIAVILSAISLFGVMITVMSERQKSLDIVRDIGASRIKVAWIHILEWGILLVSGVICGGVVGITVYEVILEIQSRFLRLPKLRGYTVEWCVQQITENPFVMAKEMVENLQGKVDMIFIDFHAEATAEKIAMGRFLDGKITALFGTHTHVQTADEQILPEGTAYITDLGMTGPRDSVIGMDAKVSFKRFETALPEKYKLAEGECMLNAVEFEVDDNTNKVISIKRIQIQ